MDEITESLQGGHVGTSFLIGLAVGYFAKKVLRLGLVLMGAVIVLLFVCEHFGIISIHVDTLNQFANTTIAATQNTGHFLTSNLDHYRSQGISALGGFVVGLKLG